MEEIVRLLEKFGLKSQECRIYLALVQLEEAQTGLLCKHTGIARSNIYSVLSWLIQKGIVSYRIQNNIKVFMPAPPEILRDLFLEKNGNLKMKGGSSVS